MIRISSQKSNVPNIATCKRNELQSRRTRRDESFRGKVSDRCTCSEELYLEVQLLVHQDLVEGTPVGIMLAQQRRALEIVEGLSWRGRVNRSIVMENAAGGCWKRWSPGGGDRVHPGPREQGAQP